MPPRKGTDLSGNGGGRELQSLLESACMQVTNKDEAAVQIPWRTSTRLQEAALRSLVKERDIDEPSPIKNEKASSPEALCARVVKRQRSPASPTTPLQPCQTEDTGDGEGSGDSSVNEGNSRKGSILCGETGVRRRKRRKVHFANPLVYYIEEKTQDEGSSRHVAERKSVQKTRNDSRRSTESGVRTWHPPKQPMSCFDLLCNYSGFKGWRCYRACVEGESYCNFHLSSRTAASSPVVRISVCT